MGTAQSVNLSVTPRGARTARQGSLAELAVQGVSQAMVAVGGEFEGPGSGERLFANGECEAGEWLQITASVIP